MKLQTVLALLACCAGLGGCLPHHPDTPAPSSDQQAFPADSLVLEVENHNWSDVVVSIIHDGITSRLTEVTAGSARSFLLPTRLVGQDGLFRLMVRGIGATDRFISESLSVRTGSTIRLTVESAVAHSSVGVW